jgi:hypothetical protein
MKFFAAILLGLGGLIVVASLSLIAVDKTMEVKQLEKKGALADAVIDRLRGDRPLFGATDRQHKVRERVELPEIEGHFWLTFLYADDWQQDAESVRLQNMFASDPRLVEMQQRCRVNSFGQMDPYLVERWRKYVGRQTPMVVLQAPDGQLCFKASRGNIPNSAEELVTQLQQSLAARFHRPCPGPCPQPTPEPQPQPAPLAPVNPLPDTVGPAEEPRDAGDPLWLLAVLGVSGMVGGMAIGRKRR